MSKISINEVVTQIVKLEDQIKALSKQQDGYKNLAKTFMKTNNLTNVPAGGIPGGVSVSYSDRKTVSDKAALLTYLMSNGLTAYIETEIKPNTDLILTAVNTGILSEEIKENFISVTQVATMKIATK